MANKGKADSKPETGANLGFEAKLWQMADGLRNNMDVAEYKHVVLGLIFLKYISDAFESKHAELETQRKKGADPKIPTNTKPPASSECRRRRAGHISRRTPRSRPLARWSTMQWPRSSATTPPSRPCCRETSGE